MTFILKIKSVSKKNSAIIRLIPDEPTFVFSLPSCTRKWTRSDKRLPFYTPATRVHVLVDGVYKGVYYSGQTLRF